MNFNKTEKIIEFETIKEKWKELAMTDKAKAEISQMKPYLSETELRTKLRETTESCRMIETRGNPPVASLNGVDELLDIAVKGGCLSVGELLAIESALTAVNRMKAYLKRGKNYEIPLAYYEENLESLDDIREAIAVTIVNEAVSDNASKYLKSLRFDIATAEEKMREKAEAAMRTYKDYISDSFSTQCSGHVCIPVKKE